MAPPTPVVPVVIAEYSDQWPVLFAAERRRLSRLLPACDIEHIGSTSVPGLAAKPIIDIMLGASALAEVEACIAALDDLGFEYHRQHECVLPNRRFFARAPSAAVGCHLHAVVRGTPFWNEHVTFRDTLRANPSLAQQYADLKQQLAERFGNDRAAYTDAKAPFIASVLAHSSATALKHSIGHGIDEGAS